MFKIILSLLVVSSLQLFGASDYDMDGVDDKLDKCPNTPLSDLVNLDGCSKKSLLSPHHFDIIFGLSYSKTAYEALEESESTTSNLQLDYYYKNYSIQLSSSYYDSSSATYSDSGINDSFLGVYYKFSPAQKLNIKVGAGTIIPTYDSELDNNNLDILASINISYIINDINFFGGFIQTMINDDDTLDVSYQNTSSYSLGLGFYPTSKIYLSAAYNSSESIYEGVDSIDTTSLYAHYSINKNWFTTLSYAYGLSDTASDTYASLRVGYYF